MNGMERKVVERSATLECNEVKRKPPAAGIGRQTIHGLHIRRVVGLFVVFSRRQIAKSIEFQKRSPHNFIQAFDNDYLIPIRFSLIPFRFQQAIYRMHQL